MTFFMSLRSSSLFHAIEDIVSLASKKKVFRINTELIVTPMKDKEIPSDCSVMHLPGKAVGGFNCRMADCNSSVSATHFMSNPHPAIVHFFNLLHKSVNQRPCPKFRMAFHASFVDLMKYWIHAINTDSRKGSVSSLIFIRSFWESKVFHFGGI